MPKPDAIGADIFDKRVEDRRQDLMVYLALAQFDGRPSLRRLPADIQLDVRSLFASLTRQAQMAKSVFPNPCATWSTVGRSPNLLLYAPRPLREAALS